MTHPKMHELSLDHGQALGKSYSIYGPRGHGKSPEREVEVPGRDFQQGARRVRLEPVRRYLGPVSPLSSSQKPESEGTKIQRQVGARHPVSPPQDPRLKPSVLLLCTVSDLWRA